MSFLPLFSSLLFFFLLLVFTPPLFLHAQTPPPPSVACKSTLYPKLCRSILSAISYSPSDPYSLGKFSIKQSLKQAKKLIKVFNKFLNKQNGSSSSSSSTSHPLLNRDEIAALIDCMELNRLNVNYLDFIKSALEMAEVSSPELVEEIQTYLSAVATNHETCYDGLVAAQSGIAKALNVPLKSVKELYSVSLGLVTDALNRYLKKHKVAKHGLLAQANKVRQPLVKLVKVIS